MDLTNNSFLPNNNKTFAALHALRDFIHDYLQNSVRKACYDIAPSTAALRLYMFYMELP
jgi:hypothetical protein